MSSSRLALALLLPPRPVLSTRSLSSRPLPGRPSSRRPSSEGSGVSSFGFDSSPLEAQRRDETPFFKPRSNSFPSEDEEYGLPSSQPTQRPAPAPRFEPPPDVRLSRSARKAAASAASSIPPPPILNSRFPRTTHPDSVDYRGPLHPSWKDAASTSDTSHPFNSGSNNPDGARPARVVPPPLQFIGRNGKFQAEDLTIPKEERHPMYGKGVPIQRGGFDLGPRVEKEEVGQEREKEEGAEVVLTLHVSSTFPFFLC